MYKLAVLDKAFKQFKKMTNHAPWFVAYDMHPHYAEFLIDCVDSAGDRYNSAHAIARNNFPDFNY